MDQYLINQFQKHRIRQFFEVSILIDQPDEAVRTADILVVFPDTLFTGLDFLAQLLSLSLIGRGQEHISVIWELSEDIVLIDTADQRFQFIQTAAVDLDGLLQFQDIGSALLLLSLPDRLDKGFTVEFGILRDRPEQVCNELDHVLLADPVLCRAECADRDFCISRAGVLGLTLAVISPVNVHLRATVSAVHQPGQQMDLTPSVRISADGTADLLDQIKSLLIDDRLLCVFEDHPVVLRNIMALLVLEMLNGLEIDRMAQILRLSEDGYNCGR